MTNPRLYADFTKEEAMEFMDHCHAIIRMQEATPRPGRAGRPDLFYAHHAAAYSMLTAAGSTAPIAELTEAINALVDALVAS